MRMSLNSNKIDHISEYDSRNLCFLIEGWKMPEEGAGNAEKRRGELMWARTGASRR